MSRSVTLSPRGDTSDEDHEKHLASELLQDQFQTTNEQGETMSDHTPNRQQGAAAHRLLPSLPPPATAPAPPGLGTRPRSRSRSRSPSPRRSAPPEPGPMEERLAVCRVRCAYVRDALQHLAASRQALVEAGYQGPALGCIEQAVGELDAGAWEFVVG
ncbi:hypothetical protein M8818_004244 [Zalaria obscura]|uniref:Uncharacterized protein n=1 Tax=Zalaria obscura TaxID=2024903 RepID=A0ACC3SCZ7_9PEZI